MNQIEAKKYRVGLFIITLFIPSCVSQFQWGDLDTELEILNRNRVIQRPPVPYHDYAGSIQLQTSLTDDRYGKIDEIVEAARKAGSLFIMTTDHHSPKVYNHGFEGWYDEILVIRGSEVIMDCPVLRHDRCGSLLILGLEDYTLLEDAPLQEVINRVNQKNGFVIESHPLRSKPWEGSVHGIVIHRIPGNPTDKPSPPIEMLQKWDAATQTNRVVGIAGSDFVIERHSDDPPWRSKKPPLQWIRTHILAPTLDKDQALAALEGGHSYMSFDILSDPTGFGFWVEDHAFRGTMGDEIEWSPDLRLRVQTPLVGRIDVIRNGEVIKSVSDRALTLPLKKPGVYRTEIMLGVRGEWWPWIYSNPIYVKSNR